MAGDREGLGLSRVQPLAIYVYPVLLKNVSTVVASSQAVSRSCLTLDTDTMTYKQ